MTDSSVIIAGAGPVGLVTALGLAQAGIEVTVIDKDETVGTSPRAMAHLYPVLDGFERLGLLEDLHREGLRSDGLNFIDFETGEHFFHTLAPLADVVRHAYTLHVGQDQISRILLRHLSRHSNVEVRYGTALTEVIHNDDDGVTVRTAGPDGRSKATSQWLVGADGATSTVRRSLGVGFDGITWPHRFIATNIRYDFEAHGLAYANFQIDRTYGAIIAKITDDGLWRYTYRESSEAPPESLPERIREHLSEALPGHGEFELVQWSPYRMHQRAADKLRVGRVVLAGDAAHITNPTGGLGLTSGFLDAFVLYEALAAVIKGTAGDFILDAYSHQRRQVFLDVVSPMATQNKQRLFDPPTGSEKEQLLAGLRHLVSDPDARRESFLALRAIVTPSLLAQAGVDGR